MKLREGLRGFYFSRTARIDTHKKTPGHAAWVHVAPVAHRYCSFCIPGLPWSAPFIVTERKKKKKTSWVGGWWLHSFILHSASARAA